MKKLRRHASSLYQANKHEYDCRDKKEMDEAADGIRRDKANSPENEQDNGE
jgi:hypothetical protein